MQLTDGPMTERADGVIECEIRIEAPPRIVFGFFTDAERMARWMGRTVTLDPTLRGRVPDRLQRVRHRQRHVHGDRRAAPHLVHLGLGGGR